jgi:hypothetical protein
MQNVSLSRSVAPPLWPNGNSTESIPSIVLSPRSKTLHDEVVSLAGRLPQNRADPTTLDAQRKALLRCLIEKVLLDRGEHDVASVRAVCAAAP